MKTISSRAVVREKAPNRWLEVIVIRKCIFVPYPASMYTYAYTRCIGARVSPDAPFAPGSFINSWYRRNPEMCTTHHLVRFGSKEDRKLISPRDQTDLSQVACRPSFLWCGLPSILPTTHQGYLLFLRKSILVGLPCSKCWLCFPSSDLWSYHCCQLILINDM